MKTWLERKREIDLALKEVEELKARAYAISLVIDDYRRLDKSEEWEAYVDENGVVRLESPRERVVRENLEFVQSIVSQIPEESLNYISFGLPIFGEEPEVYNTSRLKLKRGSLSNSVGDTNN